MQRDELVALERRFWQAAGDATIYRERFAEDGRCVFGFATLDKASTVAAIDGAPPWVELEMDEVTVVPLGEDAVALTYAADARRADGSGYRARVSSVYVHRTGTWLLALHQQTPVPDAT